MHSPPSSKKLISSSISLRAPPNTKFINPETSLKQTHQAEFSFIINSKMKIILQWARKYRMFTKDNNRIRGRQVPLQSSCLIKLGFQTSKSNSPKWEMHKRSSLGKLIKCFPTFKTFSVRTKILFKTNNQVPSTTIE